MKGGIGLASRLDKFLRRQTAWIQAAFGFYPEKAERVQRLRWMDWSGLRDVACSEGYIRSLLEGFVNPKAALPPFHENHYKKTFRLSSAKPGGQAVFLKSYRFHRPSGLNPRNWVRRLKPQKCFRLSYQLESLNIPTAKVLFYLKRKKGNDREYILATEELPSTDVLNRWVRTGMGGMDEGQRAEFMSQLGTYVGLVHRNGIYHRTLEYSIIVCMDPLRFFLIDLDHVMTVGAMFGYERRRQLGRFEELLTACGATSADLGLFYSAYENQMEK